MHAQYALVLPLKYYMGMDLWFMPSLAFLASSPLSLETFLEVLYLCLSSLSYFLHSIQDFVDPLELGGRYLHCGTPEHHCHNCLLMGHISNWSLLTILRLNLPHFDRILTDNPFLFVKLTILGVSPKSCPFGMTSLSLLFGFHSLVPVIMQNAMISLCSCHVFVVLNKFCSLKRCDFTSLTALLLNWLYLYKMLERGLWWF